MVNSAARAFGGPLRYIQGPGEFDCLLEYTGKYGKACILIDSFLYSELTSKLEKACERTESGFVTVSFQGECCDDEVERVKKLAKEHNAAVIAGVGGGKVLDVVKLCADALELPAIIVPSAASTDAPVSEIAVLYTNTGEYIGSRKIRRNADLVLVDSSIIVKAPKRLFVAGIGDALATWFEAKACEASGSVNYIGPGYHSCKAGLAIAETCKNILFEDGIRALDSFDKGVVTEAFENVVEANILLSGLGFLNTGLATAHGIHSGLTALPETHKFLHGEKVAFGIVCQMMLENTSVETVDQTMRFMAQVGLPITLKQLDVAPCYSNIAAIAKKVVEGPLVHHEYFSVDAEAICNAILMADELGQKFISNNQQRAEKEEGVIYEA